MNVLSFQLVIAGANSQWFPLPPTGRGADAPQSILSVTNLSSTDGAYVNVGPPLLGADSTATSVPAGETVTLDINSSPAFAVISATGDAVPLAIAVGN